MDKYARTRPIAFPVFGAYEVTTAGAITQPGDRLALVGVVGRWSAKGLYTQTSLYFKLLRAGDDPKDIEMNADTGTARIASGAYVGLAGFLIPRLSLVSHIGSVDHPEELALVEGADIWQTLNGRENPERLRRHAQDYERVKHGDKFLNGVIYECPDITQSIINVRTAYNG